MQAVFDFACGYCDKGCPKSRRFCETWVPQNSTSYPQAETAEGRMDPFHPDNFNMKSR